MEGERPLKVGSRQLWLMPQVASFALLAVEIAFLAWFGVALSRNEDASFTWLFSAFVPSAASGMFGNAARLGPTTAGKRLAAAAAAVLPVYAIVLALVFAFVPSDVRVPLISAVCALAVLLGIFCGILTERLIAERIAEDDAAARTGWAAQAR